jgi:tRNA-splicing ligase RtcB
MLTLKKIDETGKPYKIYADRVESMAIEQFVSAMEQDFAVQGALMPDAHEGYSLPIGAVVASKQKVVPAWVGFDIGCGVCAVPTTFPKGLVRSYAEEIYEKIYETIPVGFLHRKNPISWKYEKDVTDFTRETFEKDGGNQLGTLGGGNHFIEIGFDENNTVWITIHSGSRNLGHAVATHYMKIASGDGKAREGHYGLDTDSDEGKAYIKDLAFCLDFALENRLTMARELEKTLQEFIEGEADYEQLINRNHNHAEFKNGLWIHRKGATHAENGMLGVIPGNMRDGSFVVKGKGNPDSLSSSSHGAGRVLSRKRAKEYLSMKDFTKTMEKIQARVERATLDESPMAYKNIFDVMANQSDLVETLHHIKPMINIKG